jgi:ABC-type glycerol-3-phosphate transport system permease component
MDVARESWTGWAARHAFAGFVYAMLVILALTMIFPYVWMIANSLKAEIDFYQHPYSIIPEVVTLETYKLALVAGRVGLYMRNSAMYAISTVVFSLLFDSLAAYAFARYQFPGREQAFTALLATMMLPGSVTLIPSFLVANYLGLTNTYLGVVLPGFADAFGIFLLRQFFLNVPQELGDAARIDGAGFLSTYWRIMLPIVKPALITLGIFNFLWQWNSFIWPLIVLSNWKMYPITVGIATFRGQYRTEWPTLFAATTAVSVPVFILFFLAQEYIVGGISLSGLKG